MVLKSISSWQEDPVSSDWGLSNRWKGFLQIVISFPIEGEIPSPHWTIHYRIRKIVASVKKVVTNFIDMLVDFHFEYNW